MTIVSMCPYLAEPPVVVEVKLTNVEEAKSAAVALTLISVVLTTVTWYITLCVIPVGRVPVNSVRSPELSP